MPSIAASAASSPIPTGVLSAGWAYDYGKGRVCYLVPGHLLTALWNPEYVKLQKNAVRFVMREE